MRTLRLLAAAVFTNLAMGLLYCWPLFADAIRSLLDVSEAVIGGVPAVSLLAFTFGVNLYPSLSTRAPTRLIAAAVFFSSTTGIALFAAIPSITTIYLGYGLLFGISSGVGYMMALAFVKDVPPPLDRLSLGISVTSFALTAIVITVPVQTSLEAMGVQQTLWLIVGGLCVCGVLVVWTGHSATSIALEEDRHGNVKAGYHYATATAFFTFCFVGLGVMANSRVVLELLGVDAAAAQASAATFNLAYVGGALSGGLIAGFIGGKNAIMCLLMLLAGSLCYAMATSSAAAAWVMTSIAACCLGATASTFPVHIAQHFGREQVTPVFARLLIFYGVAGSISPWLLASTLSLPGGIKIFLATSLCLCVVSITGISRAMKG